MAKLDVYNIEKKKVSKIDLEESVFGVEVKEHLLHAVVRYQRAAKRQGTHAVRSRSFVRGGGAKPFRQKGTGRARQGTIRAPQWRGGGIVHGPTSRSHAFKLNKKVRRLALRCALSRRVQEEAVVVLDEISFPEIKTKNVVSFLERFDLSDALVIVAEDNDVLGKSARNLQQVTVLPFGGVNVVDVMRRKNIVLTAAAVEAISERLRG